MRKPGFMKLVVGVDHSRRDPCAGLARARRGCAVLYDVRECCVDAHIEFTASDPLAQRARHAELLTVENHPRVGTPPQYGLTRAEPGKDAAAIGCKDALRREIAAGSKQPIRVVKGRFERRKRTVETQPGNHAQNITIMTRESALRA